MIAFFLFKVLKETSSSFKKHPKYHKGFFRKNKGKIMAAAKSQRQISTGSGLLTALSHRGRWKPAECDFPMTVAGHMTVWEGGDAERFVERSR
jgi:hypothetical protein